MAGISKVNPAAVASNVEMVGKDIQFFTVDYVNTNTSTGIDGAQMATHRTIAASGTIVAIGPMLDSNTQQTSWVCIQNTTNMNPKYITMQYITDQCFKIKTCRNTMDHAEV